MRLSPVLLAALLPCTIVPAQDGPNYTLAERFSSDYVRQRTYSSSVQPKWIGETDRFWYAYEDRFGWRYELVEPGAKQEDVRKRPLFDRDALAAKLSLAVKQPLDAEQMRLSNADVDDEGRVFSFIYKDKKFELELVSGELTDKGKPTDEDRRAGRSTSSSSWRRSSFSGSGDEDEPKSTTHRLFSPDNTAYVFARGHDLYYVEASKEVAEQVAEITARIEAEKKAKEEAEEKEKEDKDKDKDKGRVKAKGRDKDRGKVKVKVKVKDRGRVKANHRVKVKVKVSKDSKVIKANKVKQVSKVKTHHKDNKAAKVGNKDNKVIKANKVSNKIMGKANRIKVVNKAANRDNRKAKIKAVKTKTAKINSNRVKLKTVSKANRVNNPRHNKVSKLEINKRMIMMVMEFPMIWTTMTTMTVFPIQ